MKIWPLIASIAFVTSVHAQTPYAGMQTRPIKALSEQQIADLGAGRGMGLALAAELNGYPGPSHVLELADKLELSAEQRASMQRLFNSMKAEAMPLGAKLIEQEAELDKQFADPHGHAGKPEGVHRGRCRDAGDATRNPSEISFVDWKHPDPVADDKVCGIARLRRRPSTSNTTTMTAPAALLSMIASQPPLPRCRHPDYCSGLATS